MLLLSWIFNAVFEVMHLKRVLLERDFFELLYAAQHCHVPLLKKAALAKISKIYCSLTMLQLWLLAGCSEKHLELIEQVMNNNEWDLVTDGQGEIISLGSAGNFKKDQLKNYFKSHFV